MAHTAITLQPEKLNIGGVAGRIGVPALFVGAAALAVAAWLGMKGGELRNHVLYSYLSAYCFFLALTIGCLLFVMIQYATRAAWSVTVRRLAEGISQNIILMIVLFIPVIAGANHLLEWLAPHSEHDHIIAAKTGYLNPTFLWIRLAAYFAIWTFAALYFAARSRQQDSSGDPAITTHLEHLSFPMIILTGFALTFFAFDWIMGLNPHWFSTIFGVYIFAGAMLSAFSAITLLALALQKRGLIGDAINHEHFQDLGKWMFAFTFFWGYIGFSQYMLIWYANIPEETQFYIPRQIGTWGSVSILLLLVHFVIPFPGLLSRHVKRRNAVIAFWAVWCLLACALDVYWLVVPNEWIREIPAVIQAADPHAAGTHGALPLLQEALPRLVESNSNIYEISPQFKDFEHHVNYAFEPGHIALTALCFVGIGGLYIFFTMLALRGKSLVPPRDPRLNESLGFENM